MNVLANSLYDQPLTASYQGMNKTNKALQVSLDAALRELKSGESSKHMQELCDSLSSLRGGSTAIAWESVKATCQAHPLFELIQEDPLSRRIYEKPRGYAGDARMMDLIYKTAQPSGASDTGRRVYDFITDRDCAHGARARKERLADLLHSTTSELDAPEILSVACGHMRETQLLPTEQLNRASRIVAFDQDEESLAEVSRTMEGCEALSVVPGSVRRLIAGRHELGSFDLIYSLGLYDYLDQRTAKRLTQVLFDALKPGGRLVIANYLPNKTSGLMEAFLDWELVYRSSDEIIDIAAELDPERIDQLSYSEEHTGTIGFLELRKSPAKAIAA